MELFQIILEFISQVIGGILMLIVDAIADLTTFLFHILRQKRDTPPKVQKPTKQDS